MTAQAKPLPLTEQVIKNMLQMLASLWSGAAIVLDAPLRNELNEKLIEAMVLVGHDRAEVVVAVNKLWLTLALETSRCGFIPLPIPAGEDCTPASLVIEGDPINAQLTIVKHFPEDRILPQDDPGTENVKAYTVPDPVLSLLAFIDKRLEKILDTPEMWGSQESIVHQITTLFEVRAVVLGKSWQEVWPCYMGLLRSWSPTGEIPTEFLVFPRDHFNSLINELVLMLREK